MVGIAQGISTAARTRVRPLNSALRISATITPNTTSSDTETMAKKKVFHTERHQTGSASTPYQRPSSRTR